MKKITTGFTSILAIASLVIASPVFAATVISPSNQGSWDFQTNNLVDGVGQFVTGPSTPLLGSGSVELSTGINGSTFSAIHNTAYAGQSITVASFAGVVASYATYVPAGVSNHSYPKMVVDITIGTTGFPDELTFDPQNQTSQTPTAGVWQVWDAKGGIWTWNGCSGGRGTLVQYFDCVGGTGGSTSVSIINRAHDGTGGIRLQVGPNASSDQLRGYVDDVTLNINGTSTTYDFENDTNGSTTPTSKDQCKKGGWQNFNSPVFKNQGSCVSFVEANENAGK